MFLVSVDKANAQCNCTPPSTTYTDQTISSSVSLTGPVCFTGTTNTISGDISSIADGTIICVAPGTTLNLNSNNYNNIAGTVTVNVYGTLKFGTNPNLAGKWTFNIYSSGTLNYGSLGFNSTTGNLTIDNKGTFSGGKLEITGSSSTGSITNTGAMTLTDDLNFAGTKFTFYNNSQTPLNLKTIAVSSSSSSLTFRNYTTMNVSSTLNLNNGTAHFLNDGDLTIVGNYNSSSTSTYVNCGTYTGSFNLNNGGKVINTGTFNTSQIEFGSSSSKIENYGIFNSSGSINASGPIYNEGIFTFSAGAQLTGDGNLTGPADSSKRGYFVWSGKNGKNGGTIGPNLNFINSNGTSNFATMFNGNLSSYVWNNPNYFEGDAGWTSTLPSLPATACPNADGTPATPIPTSATACIPANLTNLQPTASNVTYEWWTGNSTTRTTQITSSTEPSVSNYTTAGTVYLWAKNVSSGVYSAQGGEVVISGSCKNLWVGSTNTTTGTDWNTASNWVDNRVPGTLEDIEFATEANNPTVSGEITSGPAKNDLEVPSGITKEIGNLTNASTKNLIVPANTALIVNGVVSVKDPKTGANSTDPSKIQIKAAKNTANGTFIINCTAQSTPGSQGDIYVTVDLYAKGFKETPAAEWTDSIIGSPTNGTKFTASYHWQHFGVPVETVKANPTFYGSYLRQYHEEWNETVDPTKPSTYYAKWEDLNNESDLVAFKGYEITQDAATTYSIAGKLQYCDKEIILTRNAPQVHTSEDDTNINNRHYGLGQNIFGNSYTASIDIDNLEFPEKVEPTVYLYNTGRFTDWAETTGGGLNVGTTLAAGQYTSIPQFASPAIYDGRIPSLNGFLLIHRGYSPYYASASDVPVTMTLPYANNLLPNTKPQTAPRKPLSYLQVNLQSKSTRDNLWLFSEEGTTNGNDDGWDGRKFFGTPTAFIYTENDDGPMQVSTNETIDGTVLNFYANSDTEYTLTLAKSNLEDYTDLHLIDLINRTATPLNSDTTRYHFTANSKGSTIRRFIIANSSNIDLTGDKFGLLHGYVKDNSRLIITNFTTEEGIVNLFDISGKRFINTKMPVSVSEIPVTLEPGVYILDLQADGKRESIKLIIK